MIFNEQRMKMTDKSIPMSNNFVQFKQRKQNIKTKKVIHKGIE